MTFSTKPEKLPAFHLSDGSGGIHHRCKTINQCAVHLLNYPHHFFGSLSISFRNPIHLQFDPIAGNSFQQGIQLPAGFAHIGPYDNETCLAGSLEFGSGK